MADNKKQHFYGTLILEGGERIDFSNYYECWEDVADWIKCVFDAAEEPSDRMIGITEDSTMKDFYIPRKKILAYSLDGGDVEK